MRLEEQRDDGDAHNRTGRALTPGLTQELFDSPFHQRMEPRLEGLALFGIREHFGGNALAFGRIGNELVNNVVGVDRLDAEFVQVLRHQRLAAGDAAR